MRRAKVIPVYSHVQSCRKPTTTATGFESSMRSGRQIKKQNSKRSLDSIRVEATRCEALPQQIKELPGAKFLASGQQEVAKQITASWHRSSADQHILKVFHVSSRREAKASLFLNNIVYMRIRIH